MKYAVEMGSGAMIYILSFIKTGSGIQKLIRRIHRETHIQHGDLISLLLFFQNKESGLKMVHKGNRLRCMFSSKKSTTCEPHITHLFPSHLLI
jgi:hypothetical protein